MTQKQNYDPDTLRAFDDQWRVLQSRQGGRDEQYPLSERFFSIFPWQSINAAQAKGMEIGCGTGRFAQFVVPHVKHLTLIDPSEHAIRAARKTLSDFDNCTFVNAPLSALDIPQGSMDFGYSYGVLHHIPDTEQAMRTACSYLKPGAPFLIYLYYAFDNRPFWFRWIWRASNLVRVIVSHLPVRMRHAVCDILALLLYWPLARTALLLDKAGLNITHFPLSDFKSSTFRRMRNNARDRFGTPLEQRFTRQEIKEMMHNAGLEKINFRDGPPYWCAVGYKTGT